MPPASSLRRRLAVPWLAISLGAPLGCGVGSMVQRDFAEQMATAVLDHDDPETVRAGAPAFLLMMDGMVAADPDNADLRRAAGTLYAAYASGFVDDEERAQRLSNRAMRHGEAALRADHPKVASLRECSQDEFRSILSEFDEDDGPLVAAIGQIWLSWIRARRDDLDAIADIPRVEELFQTARALGESADGAVALNLAILRGMDVMMGMGDLSEVQGLFEEALRETNRQSLMVQIAYATMYADAVGDTELYEALLDEVLTAEAAVPGRTLMNVMAQERARALLAGEDIGGF